jgi:hypothetical protein
MRPRYDHPVVAPALRLAHSSYIAGAHFKGRSDLDADFNSAIDCAP